ncbi:MAG: HD domain-containing protein [Desulfobacterales bacterium]|nr:MAG: HD domain-containing protein [Desulfobacterales bacterium]
MRIPSKKECYRLMCEMEMLDHIVQHSLQVGRVASFLVDRLTLLDVRLHRELIQAAALLHDITKTRSFQTGENHAVTGAEFLTDLGYPEVADLVRQHVRLDIYFAEESPDEAEVVNYADKRVLHDKVVTLDQRMGYILAKYGKAPDHQERLRWLWEKSELMEDRIFSDLPFLPEEINRFMNPEDGAKEFDRYQKVCARLSVSTK